MKGILTSFSIFAKKFNKAIFSRFLKYGSYDKNKFENILSLEKFIKQSSPGTIIIMKLNKGEIQELEKKLNFNFNKLRGSSSDNLNNIEDELYKNELHENTNFRINDHALHMTEDLNLLQKNQQPKDYELNGNENSKNIEIQDPESSTNLKNMSSPLNFHFVLMPQLHFPLAEYEMIISNYFPQDENKKRKNANNIDLQIKEQIDSYVEINISSIPQNLEDFKSIMFQILKNQELIRTKFLELEDKFLLAYSKTYAKSKYKNLFPILQLRETLNNESKEIINRQNLFFSPFFMIANMLNIDANQIIIDLINSYLLISDGDLNHTLIENLKVKINIDFANNEMISKIYQGGLEFIIDFAKLHQRNSQIKKCLPGEESKKFINKKIHKVIIEPIIQNIIQSKEFQEYCQYQGIKLNQIIDKSKHIYSFFETYKMPNQKAFSKELQIPFQEFKKDQEIFIAMITVMKFYNIKFNITE